MERIPGQRAGTFRYLYDGYLFHEDPRFRGRRYICSSKTTQDECTVSALVHETNQGDVVTLSHNHHHNQPTLTIREPAIKALRDRAHDYNEYPGDIVNGVYRE